MSWTSCSNYPGQFLPRESALHRWPAGHKVLLALGFALSALLRPTPLIAVLLLAFCAVLYAASRLGWRAMKQDAAVIALQAPLVLLVFYWRDGPAGLSTALLVSTRLALVTLPGLWLQRTTSIIDLSNTLARRLPAKLAFVLAMSLRFLPLLARDAREIYLLQRIRGARLAPRDLLNPRNWGEACHCLAVPVLMRALHLADQVAVAAEQRKVGVSDRIAQLPPAKKLCLVAQDCEGVRR